MRRRPWLILFLPPVLFALIALAACATLPQKTPDQVEAGLPASKVAVDRKALGNGLLTGLLAYQFMRPYAEAACRPTTPGGPPPSQECFDLAGLDQQLKSTFDTWWDALFTFVPGAGSPQVDWGKILGVMLDLLLKLAGKVVLGMRPGLVPAMPVPMLPQIAPRLSTPSSMLDDLIETRAVLPQLREMFVENAPFGGFVRGLEFRAYVSSDR